MFSSGLENTSACWKCALCEKDMAYLANEEEPEHSNQLEENDQLQYYLFSSHRREELRTLLPEAAVLPCSHVFHGSCLSELQLTNLTDPSCPLCDMS